MTITKEPRLNDKGGWSISLGRGAGSHWAEVNAAGEVVVEWYHHGEDAAYEFANQLVFAPAHVPALLGATPGDDAELLRMLAARFQTYWQVSDHAGALRIPFSKRTDFWP